MEFNEGFRKNVEEKILSIVKKDFLDAIAFLDLVNNNNKSDAFAEFYKSIVKIKNTNLGFIGLKELLNDLTWYLEAIIKLLEDNRMKKLFDSLDEKLILSGSLEELLENFNEKLEGCYEKMKSS